MIYTDGGEFLLLERRRPPGFWQSVTGSLEWGELADAAARRELVEETGITQGVLVNLQWTGVRDPAAFGKVYAPGVTPNLEHAFRCGCRAAFRSLTEHVQYRWTSYGEAPDGVLNTNARSLPRFAFEHAANIGHRHVHGLWRSGLRVVCCSSAWARTSSRRRRPSLTLCHFRVQVRASIGSMMDLRTDSCTWSDTAWGIVDLQVFESSAAADLPLAHRAPGFAAQRQPRRAQSSPSALRQMLGGSSGGITSAQSAIGGVRGQGSSRET